MKKGLVAILVVAAVVLGIFFWFQSTYNGMVKMDEGVQAAWSQVENVYQRRADLIPNLVATVKGYAAHEQETLEGVISARSKATQITVDPQNLTPEEIAKYQKAQGELGSALGKLLAITENYPDLKANENFMALQSQLENTSKGAPICYTLFRTIIKIFTVSPVIAVITAVSAGRLILIR